MFSYLSPALTLSVVALSLTISTLPGTAKMRLTSNDLVENGQLDKDQVLEGFGCTGGDLAPSLAWSGAPKETQSYILTMYDPDAPTGSGFWHWSVFNIPGSTTELPEGSGTERVPVPAGAVYARNDFSKNAYSGACPPEGQTHRYIYTVYAMPQASLPIDETASGALVGFFAKAHSLDSASIQVRYGR